MSTYPHCARKGCKGRAQAFQVPLCDQCMAEFASDQSGAGWLLWIKTTPGKHSTRVRNNRRSLSVSGALYERLQVWSETTGNPMSQLVESLINQHLNSGLTEAATTQLTELQKIARAAKAAGESRHDYMTKAALMRIEKDAE